MESKPEVIVLVYGLFSAYSYMNVIVEVSYLPNTARVVNNGETLAALTRLGFRGDKRYKHIILEVLRFHNM
jgi:hypothetical protein